MHLVVELGDGLSQGLDAGRGTVLARRYAEVDGLWSLEAAGNVVLDLGSALAQVGPRLGLIQEAVLAGALSAPDDTGGRSASVEAGVGHVAFVRIAELSVDLGLDLCRKASWSAFSHDREAGLVVLIQEM